MAKKRQATNPEASDTERHLQAASQEGLRAVEYVNRWAIIVGISEYQYHNAATSLNLKYAHRDAEKLDELIRTPVGGAFEAKRICKLINTAATTSNIIKALRSFLKKPARDDIVLIYFACHGAPDPDRPQNVYLISYDTDPNDVSGTGLPMREIDNALRENLLAERVVLIADTCHSAAIGGGIGGRDSNAAAVVNYYMQQLKEAKPGLALLTSAEANERSLEDQKWGGGHGVFTHYLLEGMRGKADTNNDGTVTIGELFDYVRGNVIDAADKEGRAQHPVIGTNAFDRNLPIAIIGNISAEDHYQLGCALYQLGWLLNDRKRFAAAVRQFQEALRLYKLMRQPAAAVNFHCGLAWFAQDNYDEAVKLLRTAAKEDKKAALAHLQLYLGAACYQSGDTAKATAALQRFIELYPQDLYTEWANALNAAITTPQHEQRWAVLIGINDYGFSPLRGCVNDVNAMHALLVEHLAFRPENIITLIDAAATKGAILQTIADLTVAPTDTVLIFFSGHAYTQHAEGYLIPHDFNNDDQSAASVISAQELHDALNAIPAQRKLAVIDSHLTTTMVELANKSATYALLVGTQPAQMAYETHDDVVGVMGRFTFTFVREVRQSPPTLSLHTLVQKVKIAMAQLDTNQIPLLIAPLHQTLIGISNTQQLVDLFNCSHQRNFGALTLAQTTDRYKQLRQSVSFRFPPFHYSFGIAFLEKQAYMAAREALELAVNQTTDHYTEATLALGIAHLRTQNYSAAQKLLNDYLLLAPQYKEPFAEPLAVLERLCVCRKHALLVGINQYQSTEIPNLRGAVNDVLAMKAMLLERYGFQEEDITVLIDKEATSQRIETAFQELVTLARDEPACFYFAGHGSLDVANQPTLVPHDGRTKNSSNDLLLQELAATVGEQMTNLVVILDAGWAPGITLPFGTSWGSRFAVPDKRPRLRSRAFRLTNQQPTLPSWTPDPAWDTDRALVDEHLHALRIGRVTLYHISIQSVFGIQRTTNGEMIVEAEFPARTREAPPIVQGVLTYALLETLRREVPNQLTYQLLTERVRDRLQWLQPFIVAEHWEENVFSAPVQERDAHDLLLQRIQQEPIRNVIYLLQHLIEKHNGQYADAYLNLGVAYAAIQEYAQSVDALQMALHQADTQQDPEMHYQLGRVLFEWNNDLNKAILELNEAVKGEPNNAAAYYFLAKAIHARVERETLVDAENAFRQYLSLGAPLGRAAEAEAFLQKR